MNPHVIKSGGGTHAVFDLDIPQDRRDSHGFRQENNVPLGTCGCLKKLEAGCITEKGGLLKIRGP